MDFTDENKILLAIRSFLEYFKKSNKKTTYFNISIKASNEKEYTTQFTVQNIQKSNTSYLKYTEISNGCIHIIIKNTNSNIPTFIEANTKEEACFEPRLQSNMRNRGNVNRITTTDILQILKTKLLSSIQGADKQITLTDAAEINGVNMTSFRIVRGEQPFYHKYGYVNEYIQPIKNIIYSLKVDDLKLIPNVLTDVSIYDTIKYIFETKKTELKDNESLVDIMKNISLEQDKEFGLNYREQFQNLSYILLNSIITKYFPAIDPFEIYHFTLDIDSNEWKQSKEKLRITSVDFPSSNTKNMSRSFRRITNTLRSNSRKVRNTRKNERNKNCNKWACMIMG